MDTEWAGGQTDVGQVAADHVGTEHMVADGVGTNEPDVGTDQPSAGPEAQTPEDAVDRVDQLLDEVEQALGRLDDGSYGRCVTCGSAIDDQRLAAAPTVLTCGNCDMAPSLRPDDVDQPTAQ
jgi:RNA polymerase-binding transcription factor DksA